LVGSGANEFATEMSIPSVPPELLVTDEARAELERFHSYRATVTELFVAGAVENKEEQKKGAETGMLDLDK